MPSFDAENQATVNAIFVIAIALALDPLRRAVQAGVDRAFFRSRLNYRATLRELSEVMTTLLDLRDVVGQVTRVVLNAMQLESSAICLVDSDGPGAAVWARTAEGTLEQWHVAIDLPRLAPVFAAPVALTRGTLQQHGDAEARALERYSPRCRQASSCR